MRRRRLLARGISEMARLAPRPHGWRALLYHDVGECSRRHPYDLGVSTAQLRDQLQVLAAAGLVATVDAAARSGQGVAVTFDDGHRSFAEHAAPVLLGLGVPATLFVTTDWVDTRDFVSKQALRDLAAHPLLTVGSHGRSHRPLTGLREDELRDETVASRAFLEDTLGTAVVAFAYPHGAVDRRAAEAVARAGYVLGFTSRWGANSGTTDARMLRRCEVVAADSPRVVLQKATGAWDWMGLRRLTAGRRR